MDWIILAVFCAVYVGMFFGELPGLALDRTGVALLGAIVLVATGRVSPREAWLSIDVATIGLLLGLMILSAQFRLGGFYTWFTRRLAEIDGSPRQLLALVIAGAAVLSALLANDIVCLAMSPILAEACARRRLNPVPFLLGLAAASNIGSAATLIGNPQNMLIGQTLQLSFAVYFAQAIVPTLVGLVVTWAILCWQVGGKWECDVPVPEVHAVPLNRWQTTKGIVILAAVVVLMLAGSVPREVVALGAAGLILTSRRMASSRYLGLVDWNLLVLFCGLFVVNEALQRTGVLPQILSHCREAGLDVTRPLWLFVLAAVLSNLISNVPATMLLLPAATHPLGGLVLALASTLAGNLILVGSIANMIVVDQAARLGIRIDWQAHARVGVPVTLATLLIAAIWLYVLAQWPGVAAG